MRAALRALPPLLFATLLWWRGHPTPAIVLGAIGLALVAVGVLSPRTAEAFDRLLQRLGAAAARAVARVLATSAWVLVTLPMWLLSRLVGHSPLRHGWVSSDSAWTLIDLSRGRSADLRPARPTSAGHRELQPSPAVRRRGHLRAAPVVALVAIGALWFVASNENGRSMALGAMDLTGVRNPSFEGEKKDIPDDELELSGLPVDDYAHEDEPWFRDHVRELLGVNNIPDLMLGVRAGDFRGEYLNVVDGRRVSYVPDDPTLDVWFFGGSTMYGIGQRDDHTIPSVIARLAETDGIDIRATNFGVSADVNWQETIRFAEALETGLPRPDLVVFYDGVNDRGLASFRVGDGNVDPRISDRLAVSDEERAQRAEMFPEWVEPQFDAARDEVEVELASSQYARGALAARALAAERGIPVVHVWQPQPFAKKVQPADAELYRRLGVDPAVVPVIAPTYHKIRDSSGVEPIDLSGVFDEINEPIFFDSSHTNEKGARIVADALYTQLRDQLAELGAQQ